MKLFCGLLVALSGLIAAALTPASAQAWPTAKPITIVVPLPPGPSVDMIARIVAIKLSESLGQTVIVENRGGANGTLGSHLVARAAPDGYTLLAATPASHVTAKFLMKNLPYDPVKDFTPIMAAAEPGSIFERSEPIIEAMVSRTAFAFAGSPPACSSMTRSIKLTANVTPHALMA